MARCASIELHLNSPSNVLLVDIAKYEDRLDDPAQGAQRFSDSIRWRGAAQALKHYVCGYHAVTETSRHAHELVPLFGNQIQIDPGVNQRPKRLQRQCAE